MFHDRRYANRIKNGSFVIGDDTYQVPENENKGHDTLHGGTLGYDAVSSGPCKLLRE